MKGTVKMCHCYSNGGDHSLICSNIRGDGHSNKNAQFRNGLITNCSQNLDREPYDEGII